MSDVATPEKDTQDDAQGDETNTLRRDDIPNNTHITACGVVLSDDGERLGEIDRGWGSSTSNPKGSGGESTASTAGDSE